MALVKGVNCGFVMTAPTDDPAGASLTFDNTEHVMEDTSPADAIKITEIGWWCVNETEESNFEVGLYASNGVVVPGEAGTLLEVERTNAKGTTAGWKRVIGLNWAISGSTSYWIGAQLDDTITLTRTNYYSSGGTGADGRGSKTTLGNPFGGGAIGWPNGMVAFYAVYEKEIIGTFPTHFRI